MVRRWNSANRSISLQVTIKCEGKKRFWLCAQDSSKINSKYAKREAVVEGSRTVFFSFPVTPQNMDIVVLNMYNKADTNFEATFEEVPLKTYNIWLDSDTREFLELNFFFSQVCGFEQASPRGRLFSSPDGKFNIKYYPVIIDYMTGKVMNTPARVGHNTGTIDAAKIKYDRYTFAERVIINLHEYSHKYRNPKLGFAIGNEKGADINALYFYLGMGFSKIDAINVFANVFLKAPTDGNMIRMRDIRDYIKRFENGEFAQIA